MSALMLVPKIEASNSLSLTAHTVVLLFEELDDARSAWPVCLEARFSVLSVEGSLIASEIGACFFVQAATRPLFLAGFLPQSAAGALLIAPLSATWMWHWKEANPRVRGGWRRDGPRE